MDNVASCLRGLPSAGLLVALLAITACGTLNVDWQEPLPTVEFSPDFTELGEGSEPLSTDASTETAPTPSEGSNGMPVDAVAWYGTIRSVEPTVAGADYLKLWHLDIWPKFGRAVGVTGADPAIDAEIERLRDKDIKATFWGNLTCGVADYGGCQLVVTRLSADDGGPTFPPERIEAWEGTVERLPAQPGGQNSLHDFILAGEVPVLYGITGADPAVQADLERLPETGTTVRIWGELRSKARPVTGTLIDVDRIEVVD